MQSSSATHPAHQAKVTKSSVPGIKWLKRETAQLSLMPIPLIRNPDALVARKDYHVIITANSHDDRKGRRLERNRGKDAGRNKSGWTQTTQSGRFFFFVVSSLCNLRIPEAPPPLPCISARHGL